MSYFRQMLASDSLKLGYKGRSAKLDTLVVSVANWKDVCWN